LIVVQAEQLNHSVDISGIVNVNGNPAGLGKDVVMFRLARGNELVAHTYRKREISHSAAVQMSELTAPQSKLNATKPVRRDADSWPGRDDADDLLLDARCHDSRHRSQLLTDPPFAKPNHVDTSTVSTVAV
jgi:hypothetical protein